MLPTVTFGISLLGILGVLAFKRWDVSHNPLWYRRVRERLDARALTLFRFLRFIPKRAMRIALILSHALVCRVSEWSLSAVRFLERKLLRFVNMVKGRGDINRKKGSTSLFLRNVVEYRDQVRKENGYH